MGGASVVGRRLSVVGSRSSVVGWGVLAQGVWRGSRWSLAIRPVIEEVFQPSGLGRKYALADEHSGRPTTESRRPTDDSLTANDKKGNAPGSYARPRLAGPRADDRRRKPTARTAPYARPAPAHAPAWPFPHPFSSRQTPG